MNMKFQEKLFQLRKERKMSQEDLAEVVGVSRQAVQKWEAGISNPDTDNLVAISNYFGVSLDSLLKEEQEPGVPKDTVKTEYVNLIPRMHYEYVSKRKLFGIPLVHVNIGWGMNKAKGILAIGNIAVGVLSFGLLSMGLFAFGAFALGLVVFAAIGLGGITFGGVAAGIVAVGGVAAGILSIGGVSVGIYSIGGMAIASRIAVGGAANAHIAIGDKVHGVITIVTTEGSSIAADKVRNLILQEYPKIWKPLLDFITMFL
jgi:transcriptional regulator with XRE-family HTH domain